MRQIVGIMVLMGLSVSAAGTSSPVCFSDYFTGDNLRIDYYHIADGRSDVITIDRMYRQGKWSGNPDHLIDPFNNGMYYLRVYDPEENRLLYSRGFNSYCGEYKTLPVAKSGRKRTFHETLMIPFPRKAVEVVILRRDSRYCLQEVFTETVDPDRGLFHREPRREGVRVLSLLANGPPSEKVDLVIVAEGYRESDLPQARKDFAWVMKTLLSFHPYQANQDRFNIRGVFSPGPDVGSDQPTHGIYNRTLLDSSFNSLGLYRYLLFGNNRNLQDVIAGIPCDTVVVMANNQRYGGGGIYNSFCIFSIRNERARYLFLHEFGHSFAGLADEYYSSAVAYDDFYPRGIEPLEPNITALLGNGPVKWSRYLSPGIAVPTPWEKDRYERITREFRQTRQRMREKIQRVRQEMGDRAVRKMEKELRRVEKDYQCEMDRIFRSEKISDVVGVFEGAGYSSRGLFRPMVDCLMFSTAKDEFCRVCAAAVTEMIRYYSD